MADVFTIGRLTQLSPESVHGSTPSGGATKQLIDLTFQMDPKFPTEQVRGTGHRFVTVVVPSGMEETDGKVAGSLGYNSWVYPLSMAFGAATISQPAGAVHAYQWDWVIALTGSIDPVSMDIEQGDANDSEQYLYTIATELGIDATRSKVAPTAKLLSRAVNKASPNGTFTGMTTLGVSSIDPQPVLPDDWSVYMDTSSASLGETKLLRAFHAKLDYNGTYTPFYALDNAQSSYAGVADDPMPKVSLLLELMKDPAVGESLWPIARLGGLRRYLRLTAGGVGVSPLIDNYVTSATGAGTGGYITFTYKGQTTAHITYSSGWSAASIQSALTALTTIGAGNCVVSGGPLPGTAVTITFEGQLQNDTSTLTLDTTNVTGGSLPNTLTVTQIPYSMRYDCSGEISDPGANKDYENVRTREWTFTMVEDSVWGAAIKISVVNALSAL